MTRNPGGGATTESPWFIQTVCSASRPAKSSESRASRADRAAVLAALVGDLSPGGLREPLHAVAEAEHRHAEAVGSPEGFGASGS